MTFPSVPGTYVLLLVLPGPAALTIGRLGTFDFPAGVYTYAGSAHGPGGLAGRLKHHLAPVPRPHWHVDALRPVTTVSAVWWCADAEIREHAWAATLADLPGARLVAPRFGASDCRCPAHLWHFGSPPPFEWFAARAGGTIERTSLERRTLP